MAAFLKEKWEDLTPEELSRARGAYIAFTTGLEEGASREQFKSLMDPMLSIQDLILELKELQAM
jgi:hypothetical protein